MISSQRMMIFIDARNIKSSLDTYNKENKSSLNFGYKELVDYFSSKYHIIRGYFYDGSPHISQQSDVRKAFYNFLRKQGITMRLKELNQQHPTQKGVDIYLASDMISLAYENAYDIAFILSGDGDYKALIELVKSKGKKVWILSFRRSLSNALKECADKVFIVENMKETLLRRISEKRP